MRLQTTRPGATPTHGSSRPFRLDPQALPVRYTASLGSFGRRKAATIRLDQEQATVRLPSCFGVSLTICMPFNAFNGVAVRMEARGESGDIEVVLELMHPDPELSLPLMITDDPEKVTADWQFWGEVLDLPLIIVGPDGVIAKSFPNGKNGGDQRQPNPRRRHSFFANRRPRFLTRRKPGGTVSLDRLDAREIIARN